MPREANLDDLAWRGTGFLGGATPGPLSAVMFDIDDTLVRASDGRLMMPIIRLARWAKRLGYIVVIITARRATRETIRYTEEQLDEIDVPYDRLLFVPAAEKSIAKQRLGYTFVLSVGDQWTDLGSSRHFLNTQSYVFQ